LRVIRQVDRPDQITPVQKGVPSKITSHPRLNATRRCLCDNELVDLGEKKNLGDAQSRNNFYSGRVRDNHINGIEGHWAYAKSQNLGSAAHLHRLSTSI